MADAADTPGVTSSEAEPQSGAEAESQSGSASAPEVKRESLTDAVADLLQMAVNYLRQETAGVMRDKVVLPGQRLGMMVAFALAASFLLALGLGFVAVALLILLAQFLTWPGALGAIGGVLLVGAAVLTALKVRSIQQ
jgi:hypothetical protein